MATVDYAYLLFAVAFGLTLENMASATPATAGVPAAATTVAVIIWAVLILRLPREAPHLLRGAFSLHLTTIEAGVTYDSPATEEFKITDTYRIDLRSSAYGVREWGLVDDNPGHGSKAWAGR